jgi:starch synthase
MKILFVASEVMPFSKTGGLADVAGALPAALAKRGHDVLVVTPRYGFIQDLRMKPLHQELRLKFPYGTEVGTLHSVTVNPNLQVLFLRHPSYFDRPGIYQENGREYGDNAQRFAFLSVGALTAAQLVKFVPDIVHANDWQTGLTPLALKRGYRGTSLEHAKSVFTIHNLAYQGQFPKDVMTSLGLPWDVFTSEGLEFYDRVSFLKAGLAYADALTTVSRKYAEEIQSPEHGVGLHGFLQGRKNDLHGILNGVDYAEWNPETDSHLPARFSAKDLSGKAACKRALLKTFGLPVEAEVRPLFGIVTRLAEQKGIDILLDALERLLWKDLSFVALGNGEGRYEDALRWLKQRYPDKVGIHIGFDNVLSHQLEAGCDFFVMPSRYEPCGLNQMYSLKYGTIPIVRATGGLDDTVLDAGASQQNGFKFVDYQGVALAQAMERALEMYQGNQPRLAQLRKTGMAMDFSWDTAARAYEELYEGLVGRTSRAVST